MNLPALPVDVRIEAGALTLTLHEVETLIIGTLIPLGGAPGEVALRVNGHTVARGRLVCIDGESAVEITATA